MPAQSPVLQPEIKPSSNMQRIGRSVEELFLVMAYAGACKRTRRQSPLLIAIDWGFLLPSPKCCLRAAPTPRPPTSRRPRRSGKQSSLTTQGGRGPGVRRQPLPDRHREAPPWIGAPPWATSGLRTCVTITTPEMVRLFLDWCADPIADSPFAQARSCVLQTLVGLFKVLLTKDPRLQPQADTALVHYAEVRTTAEWRS